MSRNTDIPIDYTNTAGSILHLAIPRRVQVEHCSDGLVYCKFGERYVSDYYNEMWVRSSSPFISPKPEDNCSTEGFYRISTSICKPVTLYWITSEGCEELCTSDDIQDIKYVMGVHTGTNFYGDPMTPQEIREHNMRAFGFDTNPPVEEEQPDGECMVVRSMTSSAMRRARRNGEYYGY